MRLAKRLRSPCDAHPSRVEITRQGSRAIAHRIFKARELQTFQDRWGVKDYKDPLNPNLDRSSETFVIRFDVNSGRGNNRRGQARN